MPRFTRRKTLQVVCSTATLSLASGCLGFSQDGGVGIRIENGDGQEHTVNIIFRTGNETVFNNQYTVSAGEEIEMSDIIDAGEYQVTVELDSGNTETVDFVMAGCNSNRLYVDIKNDGSFWAGVLDEC